MKTLFTLGILIVFALIAKFLLVFVLNIAGLPGSAIAGKPVQRQKLQFIAGTIVAALGQSFAYIAFTAFIVNWTMLAINYQKVSIIVWPVAFLAVVLPVWFEFIGARIESREQEYANPQAEALQITVLLTLVSFFLFAFFPDVMQTAYGWVPYMRP